MDNVLFVCLGNICRSPTAHGVFRSEIEKRQLGDAIAIDSAGTGDWHIGRSPDPRAVAAALSRGYDIADLIARQVQAEDFERFNYILAMDDSNLNDLQQLRPSSYRGHLGLFLDFCENSPLREVPDPYYGGDGGFEQVLDLIEDASSGLLRHLQSRGGGEK